MTILQTRHAGARTFTLSLATTHTQARYALVPTVMRFRQRFPRVQLAIQQFDAHVVADLVAAGNVEIGIANEALGRHPGLDTWEIYRWSHVAVVPHGHPLARKNSLSLRDLAAFPLVLTERGIAGRGVIDAAFAAARLSIDVPLAARDADVIKAYVEAGLGVGIIPGIAWEVNKDFGLVTLPVGHLFGEQSARLAVRRGHYVNLYANEFIRLLIPAYQPSYLGIEP